MNSLKIFLTTLTVTLILVGADVSGRPCFFWVIQDKKDPLNGPKIEYHRNGNIMREYNLKDAKVDGLYRTFDLLGRLVSEQQYKDGEPNGYLRTYYSSGGMKAEIQMHKGGDISGPSREFYENGTLKSESNLSGEAPKLSGQTKSYRENGQLQSESTFSQGELVIAITYDQQGRVTSEQKPGQIVSYWYENNGKKHTSVNGVERKEN